LIFFEKWGEIEICSVNKDPTTGLSRQCAFVTYVNTQMVEDCLAAQPHVIDRRQVYLERVELRNKLSKKEAHTGFNKVPVNTVPVSSIPFNKVPVGSVPVNKVPVSSIKTDLSHNHPSEQYSMYSNIHTQSVDIVVNKLTGKKLGLDFVYMDDRESDGKKVSSQSDVDCELWGGTEKSMKRDIKSEGDSVHFSTGFKGRRDANCDHNFLFSDIFEWK